MDIASIEFVDRLRGLIDYGLFILIWLVQLIIYPSLAFADRDRFKAWHYRYTGLISIFVAPLMFSQIGIYAWQSWFAMRWHDWTGLGLIAAAWSATLFLSVPCHDSLQKHGFDPTVIDRLVRTNWWRTASWTAMVAIDCAVGVLP